MTTGVGRIDTQHQELIRRVNGLMDAMRAGKGKDEVEKLLAFLAEYALKHFADEEAEMERAKCPAAMTNRLAHQQFVRKFNQLRERIERQGVTPTIVLAVQKDLVDWIATHIRGVDSKLAACVATASSAGVA
ncbi:MAG: hemerythrin family protein [Thermogutta sp.]|nr:hemerythrin family protein [Thermogutta sp.]